MKPFYIYIGTKQSDLDDRDNFLIFQFHTMESQKKIILFTNKKEDILIMSILL